MTPIPIVRDSGGEGSTFFLLIAKIIETSIDKTTDFGIGTGDDI
jgi:hypothetical protein